MSPARPGQPLTARERAVVARYLLTDNAEATGAEFEKPISAHAVREHFRRVQDKTGLTRAELTILLCSKRRPVVLRKTDETSPVQLVMVLQ